MRVVIPGSSGVSVVIILYIIIIIIIIFIIVIYFSQITHLYFNSYINANISS